MEEQKSIVDGAGDLGGTMRLGLYPAALTPGSLAAEAYGAETIEERHRHRYEVNNAYRAPLEEAGLVFSGINPDLDLVEFVEPAARGAPLLRRHPGAPRAALAPDPPAPVVRRPGRRRHLAPARDPPGDRRVRVAPRAHRGLSDGQCPGRPRVVAGRVVGRPAP
ncbi:hypothetical protein [Nocardioides convexus]|uniref:hypothetical protein n=1 Tax=Nocardioides convexus TaxID=2712224 RepID=UPI0024182264|nr:hypothetical protein [Nocardioides convexus]